MAQDRDVAEERHLIRVESARIAHQAAEHYDFAVLHADCGRRGPQSGAWGLNARGAAISIGATLERVEAQEVARLGLYIDGDQAILCDPGRHVEYDSDG